MVEIIFMKYLQRQHAIHMSAKKLAQHMEDVLSDHDLFDVGEISRHAKIQLSDGWPELYGKHPKQLQHDVTKVIELALRNVYLHMNQETLDAQHIYKYLKLMHRKPLG